MWQKRRLKLSPVSRNYARVLCATYWAQERSLIWISVSLLFHTSPPKPSASTTSLQVSNWYLTCLLDLNKGMEREMELKVAVWLLVSLGTWPGDEEHNTEARAGLACRADPDGWLHHWQAGWPWRSAPSFTILSLESLICKLRSSVTSIPILKS